MERWSHGLSWSTFSLPSRVVQILALTAASQIWDLFKGKHMFYGNDPDGKGYSTRAHLAEVIGMLGPPPVDLLERGKRSREFFTEDGSMNFFALWACLLSRKKCILIFGIPGEWKVEDVKVPQGMSLEESEKVVQRKGKELFLSFMKGMLQWRPEDRKTARQLLEDPWLNEPTVE